MLKPIYGTDADIDRIATHPRVQRVPGRNISLFIQRDFLSAEECAALIERIEQKRRPSTIADANGDSYFRTSETCDLDPADPLVAAIDAKLSAFVGIDPAHGEPIQGQRYDVGQEFKAHTDYFDPKGLDFARYCSVAGNRTWTLMVYLNEPVAGGATRFNKIGKMVQPQTGKLLAWNNRLHDIDLTAHAGEVVGLGGLDGQGQREFFLALFGVLRGVGGAILVDGKLVSPASPRDAQSAGTSLARSRSGGSSSGKTLRRNHRSGRSPPASTIACRSRLLAATRRTSARCGSPPPTRS